jgi:hypothetical protein
MNVMAQTLIAQIDHLVIAAATLAEGVAWCEATLGVTPGPGGQHPLMGTHNRLLKLHCANAPNAYLEIIAINPLDTPTRLAPQKRWFDLDDPAMQTSLAQHGPQLVHWVASVPNLDATLTAWKSLDIDRGPAVAASRSTPGGLLQWQIAVRDDGQRLFDGCLPTLIQWGDIHPATSMLDSGLTLQGLAISHPQASKLSLAFDAIGLKSCDLAPGPAAIRASLQTPKGPMVLTSLLG